MEIDKDTELKNCTLIKAILMLLIVLYHSSCIYVEGSSWGPYPSAEKASWIGYTAEWLNSFHIYAFALISGYIFYFIKYEKGGYQDYWAFLRNKTMRLLVPYVFIAAVWVVPVNVLFFPEESIVEKFLLGYSPRQLWFLLMLFWVFAIFWLISDIAARKPILVGIGVCLLYGIGLLLPGIFSFSRGLQYLPFFYMGFLMRGQDWLQKCLYKIPSILYLTLDVALFVAAELLSMGDGVLMKLMFIGISFILHMVGAVSAFVILQRLIGRWLHDNRVIGFFAKHSMSIYLVHQQLIYFAIGWLNGAVSPVLVVAFSFMFSVMVSVGFSVLMHKTRITRFLIGVK